MPANAAVLAAAASSKRSESSCNGSRSLREDAAAAKVIDELTNN
jgi:hypothetical protein